MNAHSYYAIAIIIIVGDYFPVGVVNVSVSTIRRFIPNVELEVSRKKTMGHFHALKIFFRLAESDKS